MKLDMSGYEPFGLEPIETLSRDEIAALQAERLQRTLQNVYENVPAYRKKFDAAGVTASDFSRLEDLEKFPFTTKRDLRENYRSLLKTPKRRASLEIFAHQPYRRGYDHDYFRSPFRTLFPLSSPRLTRT
jgi:phenylacetate-coenzyme A ligase PaaK-like adenylate-forming protein